MAVKLRIAVDVQIPMEAEMWLSRVGYFVLVRARQKESDQSWLQRAVASHCDAIVTRDQELSRLARSKGLDAVSWTEGQSRINMIAEIIGYLSGVYNRRRSSRKSSA